MAYTEITAVVYVLLTTSFEVDQRCEALAANSEVLVFHYSISRTVNEKKIIREHKR